MTLKELSIDDSKFEQMAEKAVRFGGLQDSGSFNAIGQYLIQVFSRPSANRS